MLVEAPMLGPKALFFDVFGTLVDWRTSVARESEKILVPLGYNLDWTAFADAWRGEYQPGMEEVRSGRQPFAKLDVLHRRNLVRLLPRFGLENLSDEVLDDLTLVWHRLDAWPDVPAAMARLKKKFWLAPCSNGNISLMVDLARRNDLPWDAILGSEDRRRLQAEAGRLSRRLRGLRSAARRLHDGRGALERSRRRRQARLAHRAHRAGERIWPEHRRGCA